MCVCVVCLCIQCACVCVWETDVCWFDRFALQTQPNLADKNCEATQMLVMTAHSKFSCLLIQALFIYSPPSCSSSYLSFRCLRSLLHRHSAPSLRVVPPAAFQRGVLPRFVFLVKETSRSRRPQRTPSSATIKNAKPLKRFGHFTWHTLHTTWCRTLVWTHTSKEHPSMSLAFIATQYGTHYNPSSEFLFYNVQTW